MSADEIAIVTLGVLDIIICWVVFEMANGAVSRFLAGA